MDDDEWIAQFSKEVRRIIGAMLQFNQEIGIGIERMLEDPINNEETIRRVLGSFGGSIHMASPRGENRDDDVVGKGRKAVWECGDDAHKVNHCTICGKCGTKAGDGHTPWFDDTLPPCKAKLRFRRDDSEDQE